MADEYSWIFKCTDIIWVPPKKQAELLKFVIASGWTDFILWERSCTFTEEVSTSGKVTCGVRKTTNTFFTECSLEQHSICVTYFLAVVLL
jgi:hypothetical protein